MSNSLLSPPFQKMSQRAKKTIREAGRIAYFHKSLTILPVHLLTAIYFERGSVGSAFLKKLGFQDDDFIAPILAEQTIDPRSSIEDIAELSEPTKKIIVRSYAFAQSSHSPYVGTEHLTHALLRSKDPEVESLLQTVGKRTNHATTQPSGENIFQNEPLPLSHFLNLPEFNLLHRPTEQEGSSAIDQFCLDLRDRVGSKTDDPHIGRTKELKKLIYILGRKKKNNALLLGEPGVGKTALVSGLMRRILEGTVPELLKDTVIYELDMASVVAGTSFRGEFEERLKAIIEEASQDPQILLFIDEIHTIVGAGNSNGALDAANILKPALARGTLRCIGATTLGEFKKHFEKDAALNRRFQSILIEEPSKKETCDILLGTLPTFEDFHHLKIEPEAIKVAVTLASRFVPERSFPDKALDIIDSACSIKRAEQPPHALDASIRSMEQKLNALLDQKQEAINTEKYDIAEKLQREERSLIKHLKEEKLKRKQGRPKVWVTKLDIEKAVAQNTGMPLDTIRSTTYLRIQDLRKHLLATVIGQSEVLTRIIQTLMRSSVGLSSSNRPLGSFLLLGPTGVGKTLSAKTIAQYFFQKKSSFIRVDMSEFRERHTISGLLGAPAGYVGYGEGGTLTEKIRRNPHCLVLFDEIEKAHPDILNILLQILEEGELTDAEGRKVSLTDTIVVLTANIGSNELFAPSSLGFDASQNSALNKESFKTIRDRLLKQLPEHIRPEILARLDEILVLEPLDKKDLQKITSTELRRIKKTLEQKNIYLSWDRSSIAFLAAESLKRNQGARPVRKVLQSQVEDVIASLLLEHKPPFNIHITCPNKKSLSIRTSSQKR